jgi:hypothetical protein
MIDDISCLATYDSSAVYEVLVKNI